MLISEARLKDLLEASDDNSELKKMIASYMQKFATSKVKDNSGLLYLIAAMTIINSSDNQSSISIARRLAQTAMNRS